MNYGFALSDNLGMLIVAVIRQAATDARAGDAMARQWLEFDARDMLDDLGYHVNISGWLAGLTPIPEPWSWQVMRTWRDWIAPVYGWGMNCRV